MILSTSTNPNLPMVHHHCQSKIMLPIIMFLFFKLILVFHDAQRLFMSNWMVKINELRLSM